MGTTVIAPEATVAEPLKTREENCEKHGKFTSMCSVFVGKFEHWSRCPECEKEWEKRRIEHEEKELQEQEAATEKFSLSRSNIPVRFQGATLENYHADTAHQERALQAARYYVEHFSENLNLGKCLILLGKVGTGKTHLACAIVNALRRRHRTKYMTVSETIRGLRATWRKDSSVSETQFMREIQDLHLLVLDEVGLQFGSEAETVQLSELIDLRYQQQRPTVIISNCDMAGLTHYLGDRAVDRLRDNGGQLIPFDWESWRKRKPGELSCSKNPLERTTVSD